VNLLELVHVAVTGTAVVVAVTVVVAHDVAARGAV
jgi:hypothetical protein